MCIYSKSFVYRKLFDRLLPILKRVLQVSIEKYPLNYAQFATSPIYKLQNEIVQLLVSLPVLLDVKQKDDLKMIVSILEVLLASQFPPLKHEVASLIDDVNRRINDL